MTEFVKLEEVENIIRNSPSFKHIFVHDSNTPELSECKSSVFETKLKADLIEDFPDFHGEELESILRSYHCKNCDFETYSLLVLIKHIDKCNTLFRPTNSREADKLSAVKTDKKSTRSTRWHKCKNCDYKTTHTSTLKNHTIYRHTKLEDIVWFRCTVCEFKCKTTALLKQHIKRKHEVPRVWFRCEQCAYKTKMRQDLKVHIKVHTNKRVRNISKGTPCLKCAQCEFKCKSKSTLKDHLTVKHTHPDDVVMFECDQCPFETKRKKCLREHLLRFHTKVDDIRWFECTHCAYKAKIKGNLTFHMRLQHEEPEKIRWFKCTRCEFKCKQKNRLTEHNSRKHRNPGDLVYYL